MDAHELRLIEAKPLHYLVSLPSRERCPDDLPVLCFLHGYDEASPLEIHKALMRHGPLREGNPPIVFEELMIIAPQLPQPGDIWYQYADAVRGIVEAVRDSFGGDAARTYLTGFSFGGNGVFDLAVMQRDFWAALWTVDPTRVPEADPGRPLWLSFGEVSRRYKKRLIEVLGLGRVRTRSGADRVYLDQGQDHVGSALLAYRDDRIYTWLMSKKLMT